MRKVDQWVSGWRQRTVDGWEWTFMTMNKVYYVVNGGEQQIMRQKLVSMVDIDWTYLMII